MSEKIRVIAVLLCLSFTCFLTQCEGCRKIDPVTREIVPNQPLYTISCGFPLPYFDVIISSASGNGYRYAIRNSYRPSVSAVVNMAALAALGALLVLPALRQRIRLTRFLLILSALIILFDLSLAVPYLPEIVKSTFVYLYVYPVLLIGSFLEYLRIGSQKNNVAARIYLVLLAAALYYLISFIRFLKEKYFKTGSVKP